MRHSSLHLSPIHFSVYEYIVNFKQHHDGLAPSVLEIGKACGITSTSMVRRHLDTLDLFGMIKCDYGVGKSRMIEIPGARWIPPATSESTPRQRAERALSISGSSKSG